MSPDVLKEWEAIQADVRRGLAANAAGVADEAGTGELAAFVEVLHRVYTLDAVIAAARGECAHAGAVAQ